MSTFRLSLAWSADWIKRRLVSGWNDGATRCVLPSCTKPKQRWRPLRGESGILLDGKFYCRQQCLETALAAQFSRLMAQSQPVPPPNRIPLGLLMVARGKLTHLEVRAALEAQRRGRYGKIGDWFEKLGFASEQDVTAALALQWGCPVVSSFDVTAVNSPGSIPLVILEAFQMLPVKYAAATGTLSLAFGERVDHAALYAIDKTLKCRTQACVGRRKSVARQLESLRHLSHPHDVEFVTSDLGEMARIASSYITRLSPDEIRVCRIGRFIWLRLNAHSSARGAATNLVFCLPANSLAPQLRTPSLTPSFSGLAGYLQSAEEENLAAMGE